MPTTLRTEFKLLEKAAEKHCKDSKKIKAWIEQLIERGVTIFEDNHPNLFEKPRYDDYLGWKTNALFEMFAISQVF